MDDLLVRGGDHALPVDLNDPVPHSDASPLGYSPSHEAADLSETKARLSLEAGSWGGTEPVLSGGPASRPLISEKPPQVGFVHLNLLFTGNRVLCTHVASSFMHIAQGPWHGKGLTLAESCLLFIPAESP